MPANRPRRCCGRGALERDRRRPSRRELRRAAGDLSQRPRRRRVNRRMPGLLRIALHRSRDRLSRNQGVRSFRVGAVDRSPAHGPLRPGRLGNHFLARHRKRVSGRRHDQRRLGPGRAHRPGLGRSRPVPRVQAALVRSAPHADHRAQARRQGAADALQARRGHHDRRDAPGAAPRLCHRRRRGADAGALGGCGRSPLRPADGYGMGQGRRDRRTVLRPGASRDGPFGAHRCDAQDLAPRRLGQAARLRRRCRPVDCFGSGYASFATRATSSAFPRVRSS